MWFPKSITIVNLFSHIETQYEFENNKCVLIYGKNSTDTGTDSNGSGKSGLIEAITLALTGATCRDTDKEGFINDFAKECNVLFTLENKFLNLELGIFRQFQRGSKASKVEIYENGEINEQITSVNEANKRIYELIGISREDLLNYFIIGQNSNHSFFTASDTEKKAIISRFTNSSVIDGLIDKLSKEKAKFDGDLVKLEQDSLRLETKAQSLQEQLDYQIENFAKDINISIEYLKSESKNYNNKISQLKQSLEEVVELKDKNEDELSKLKFVSVEDIEKKIKAKKVEIRNIENEINEARQEKHKFDIILSGTQECPKCKTKFLPKSEYSIVELNKMILEIDDLIKTGDEEIDKLKIFVKKQNEKIEEVNIENEKIRKLKSKISIQEDTLEETNQNIASLETKIKRSKEEIQKKNIELESNTLTAKIKSDLKQCIDDAVIKQEKIFEIIKQTEDYTYWIYNFGKKGFQTYLANQSIKTIEGVTNLNLKKMNTNLSVLINGYTLLKNGDVREKIDISIIRDGKNQGNYEKYSGGEKGRINVSGIVGLHKLINLSTPNGGINLLCLDEIFEGLDNQGQTEVLKILNGIGITTMVISHMNNSIGFENELIVHKVNGISILKIN